MNTTFDWTLARSFLAVMEHGSLLAAARSTATTQPTLGRHMAELERQVGATLFERTGRALVPTAMALRLVEYARRMDEAAHAFQRGATASQKSPSGTVRLATTETMAFAVMPTLVAAMRQNWPDIQVELVASDRITNLLRREADIAVRMVRPAQSDLIVRRVGSVPLQACAHRSYLKRRGTPRRTQDLLAHDLVGTDHMDDLLRGFAALGNPVTREHFAFRTDHLLTYWSAVRAGLGVGFVTSFLRRTDPEVVALLPQLKTFELPVWLAVHRDIRHTTRIRLVFEFLARQLPIAIES